MNEVEQLLEKVVRRIENRYSGIEVTAYVEGYITGAYASLASTSDFARERALEFMEYVEGKKND